MAGKQRWARSGADPVGSHDKVGIQLARRGGHAPSRRSALPCLLAGLDGRHLS